MGAVEARGLLVAPERPETIPEQAQWLGGVGAGSWFALHHDTTMGKNQYRIQRFSPDGLVECDSMFFLKDKYIDISKPYEFTYLAHCEICTILQGGNTFELKVIKDSIS